MHGVLALLLSLLSLVNAGAGERGGLYEPEVGRSVRPGMKVLDAEERDGYECRLVEFSVEKGERVKGYLLVPDGASWLKKKPAVVMLHDHGARFDIGKEKLVKPMESSRTIGGASYIMKSSWEWVDRYFDGVWLADSLASLGYVVFVSDALYWGDRSSVDAQTWSRMNFEDSESVRKSMARRQKDMVYEGQREVYDSLAAGGVIWAEKMLRDDVASVRMLMKLPFVDRNSIGAFGFSMGAHRCWMLSAFCRDVKCGVALSWMTTLDGYDSDNASDLSMRVQPMRDRMDFGDIALWLRPKPMLFLNGDSDPLFPVDKVQKAFGKLQMHYSSYNEQYAPGLTEPAFEPLRTVFFKGGHHCGKEVQEAVVNFFDENL